MYIERTLHGAPYRESFFGSEGSNHTVVLYIEVLLSAGGIFAFYNEVCLIPNFINIPFFYLKLFKDIVFAPDNDVSSLALLYRMDLRIQRPSKASHD